MTRLTVTQKLAIEQYRKFLEELHYQFSAKTCNIAKTIVDMGMSDKQSFLTAKTDTQYYNMMLDVDKE